MLGKYKGRRFDQVPEDYLRYLLTLSSLWPETRRLIELYLDSKQPAQRKKKENLDYKPAIYKAKQDGVRTEEGKERFRELSRQVKEKYFNNA
jgi:hypothetical protein